MLKEGINQTQTSMKQSEITLFHSRNAKKTSIILYGRNKAVFDLDERRTKLAEYLT
jgi:hypothetical protein